MSTKDTIAAVSSPPGRSWRGMIRISGPRSLEVATAMLEEDDPLAGVSRLTPVRLRSPSIPALAMRFVGPRSFTGDDVVELQIPGHPALLDRLLHQATAAGARLAEPGEFTFRAFTAGRIDLTQAEGIAATIAAVSDSQLQAAAMLREGKLGSLATELVNRVGDQLALVEAGIDFTDQEDVAPIAPGELESNLAVIAEQLHTLLTRSRSWGSLEALPRVVLVGPPSSGKSTLFNALLGRTRAVISAMPGTTRDVLAEPVTLVTSRGRRVEVMLVDIAGLDEPAAALDAQAQEAARRAIDEADLILNLIAPQVSEISNLKSEISTLKSERSNVKLQIPMQPSSPPLRSGQACLDVRAMIDIKSAAGPGLAVSAVTGRGLDDLRLAIADRIAARGQGDSVAAQRLALQPRHESALRSAAEHLEHTRCLLAPRREQRAIHHVELVAGSLRAALDELAGLGGQLTPDEVIGRVFATFCVGK